MPQPILSLHPNPTIRLDARFMAKRPDVAGAIAQCIANWSWIETQVAALFVALLGTKLSIGAGLYSEMDSARVKDRALRSVALTSLNDDERTLLDAILTLVKADQKVRDKLAHWYWGVCDEIGDGLVMVDPKYLTAQRARLWELAEQNKPIPVRTLDFDYNKIFVVRIPELVADAKRFEGLALMVGKFINLVGRADQTKRDELRLELSDDARVQVALLRLKPDQSNPPTQR